MTLYRFKRAQMIFLLDSGHFIGYFTVSCREINAGSIHNNAFARRKRKSNREANKQYFFNLSMQIEDYVIYFTIITFAEQKHIFWESQTLYC